MGQREVSLIALPYSVSQSPGAFGLLRTPVYIAPFTVRKYLGSEKTVGIDYNIETAREGNILEKVSPTTKNVRNKEIQIERV